ncbi:hypothetical protein RUND412_005705 [Rhizina undulata]
MASTTTATPQTPTARSFLAHLPPVPPSPSQSFASTAYPTPSLPPPTAPPLPTNVLSRADVTASIKAYEALADTAKGYRKALASVATAASSFGAALEACARCKGAGDTADGLMNAGGLQYLIASNTHILSESLYRGFEVPLLHELDTYKEKTAENEERYKKEAGDKSRELRKREQEHLKLARQRKRNLHAFRSALVDLTRQIDELDNLKYNHFRNALSLAQETSTRILDTSALVVRAEIEIFEKIAQKGWDSSGGLDDLISRAADPFSLDPMGCSGGEIFSILPSQSILPSPHSPMARSESITAVATGDEGKYQSLTGALSNGDYEEYEESIFSGGFSNPGVTLGERAVALPPFSPAPSSAGWGQRTNSANTDMGLGGLMGPAEIRARERSPGGGLRELSLHTLQREESVIEVNLERGQREESVMEVNLEREQMEASAVELGLERGEGNDILSVTESDQQSKGVVEEHERGNESGTEANGLEDTGRSEPPPL